jgi:hypothetical protein
MPTTTAKMTTITIMTTMVRLKIARACGDCGWNTFTTSAMNSAALNEWRFISFRLPALANGAETDDERHPMKMTTKELFQRQGQISQPWK